MEKPVKCSGICVSSPAQGKKRCRHYEKCNPLDKKIAAILVDPKRGVMLGGQEQRLF